MDPRFKALHEFRATVPAEIEALRKLIQELKEHYSIAALEALRKELHRLRGIVVPFGYAEVGRLSEQLEVELLSKMKNYHLINTPPEWFEGLDKFLVNLADAFGLHDKRIAMEEAALSKKDEKKRIVVVDDDEDLQKLLTYEFRELGFEVQSFKNGQSALQFLLNPQNLSDVFLLVLDRMLPDMDGLEILQQFNEKSEVKVPVLILSVLSKENDIIAGLQSGAIDYIPKPFSVFMLMQKALNLLKSQTL